MKNLLLLILLSASFIHAKVQYTETTLFAYSNPADTKLSGKILPTTPIEVLKVKGDKALIKMTGWNQGKLKRVMYYAKGNRIISAAFSKKAKYEHKILKTDASGKKPWHKVEMTTWIQNKNLANDIKPLFARAKTLIETNCALCHASHPTHEFSANQWPSVIKGMAPRTPMTKEQVLLITQFAQKHSKDMKKH